MISLREYLDSLVNGPVPPDDEVDSLADDPEIQFLRQEFQEAVTSAWINLHNPN